jgi:DNA (cytosine-5)-methyltransferase 1
MSKPFRVLNLYACLGGNRYKWTDCDVTAVELDPELARLYQERFPNDTVIIADAHQYLLDHYKEFDFIWSSPPCPTHSRTNYFTQAIKKVPTYPDMKLWQEIIYLNQFFKGLWVVENVIPYYEPFLPQYTQIGRHFLWSNFRIPKIEMPKNEIGTMMKQYVGTGKHAHDKSLEDRNAVNSELGLHILNCAMNVITSNSAIQIGLFQQ